MRLPHLTAALAPLAALLLAGSPPATAASTAAGPLAITRNFTLLSHFDEFPAPPGETGYSACWSYVHGDGREYAILGLQIGTAIYNVTDPVHAYRVAYIPGPVSTWREAKSYRNWVYITTEGSGIGQGLQIVRMSDPEHPVLAATYTTNFIRSHTVAIDTTRAILICNGTTNAQGQGTGMRVLSIANPEAPVELSWWPGGTVPIAAADYVHDCVPVGNLLYAASIYGGYARVFDFSNPAAPAMLESWTYPGAFSHNIWPDRDGQTIYVTDEVNGEPLKIFDVSDPAHPQLVNGITSNPQAIVHNAHVLGDELYLANYTEGVRALDISDPRHPAEFASADSYFGPSGGFYGVWEACPYFPSGIVIASDRETGLYIYRPDRDYGLIRARVAYADGSPVARAQVMLTTQGDSLETPSDGIVQFAPSPGAHTVRARVFGCYDASATRLVSTGSRDTVLLTMIPRARSPFSGLVRDARTGAALEDAEVRLEYTPLATIRTDPGGRFDFGKVPVDAYRLSVHAPGYVPLSLAMPAGGLYPGQTLSLQPAEFHDDFETDRGWTVGGPGSGDDATTGRWVRVTPLGTGIVPLLAAGDAVPPCCQNLPACTGQCPPALARKAALAELGGAAALSAIVAAGADGDVAPGADRSPGAGTQCYVTGQGSDPSNFTEADIDNGHTSLTSPRLDLSRMAKPAIGYWRWWYATGRGDDWFAVALSNDDGATWVPVDTVYAGFENAWKEVSISVRDFVAPTDRVRVRFSAADTPPDDIVEAAVDDVTAYDAAGADLPVAPAAPPASGVRAWPNPARAGEALRVAFAATLRPPSRVALYDLAGRRVDFTDVSWIASGAPSTLAWKPAVPGPGLYFLRLEAGASMLASTRLVVVQ
ncbi:MAG TPA: choice-of-anchor B family protein [Candidatus Sulfotelmatobacter sp.]|nr:choice-of-anchor B family protein [Candidatus Sulfotelmatobacter sp.]